MTVTIWNVDEPLKDTGVAAAIVGNNLCVELTVPSATDALSDRLPFADAKIVAWERWKKSYRKCTTPRFTFDICWLLDGGIDVSVGNGEFTGNVRTVAEVLPCLQATIAKHHPESKYNVERKGGTIPI